MTRPVKKPKLESLETEVALSETSLKREREEDADELAIPDEQEQKPATDVPILKTENSESYIELGKMKRVTVRKFKGTVLVDIREYYGQAGEERPGKKGISLTVDQWKLLQKATASIDSMITATS